MSLKVFTKNKSEAPDSGYTVRHISGCRVVLGSVPLTDISDLIGAKLVMGEPADVAVLRSSRQVKAA